MSLHHISIEFTKGKTRKERAAVELLMQLNFKCVSWTPKQLLEKLQGYCQNSNTMYKQGADVRAYVAERPNSDGTIDGWLSSKDTIAQIFMRPISGYIDPDGILKEMSYQTLFDAFSKDPHQNAVILNGKVHTPAEPGFAESCETCSLKDICDITEDCPAETLFGEKYGTKRTVFHEAYTAGECNMDHANSMFEDKKNERHGGHPWPECQQYCKHYVEGKVSMFCHDCSGSDDLFEEKGGEE